MKKRVYHYPKPVSIKLMRLILAVCIISFISFNLSSSWAQESDTDYFYYSDGQKIPLNLSTQRIAVSIAPTMARSALEALSQGFEMLDIQSSRKLDAKDLVLIEVKGVSSRAETLDLLADLKYQPDIQFTALVFESGSTDMIVTDEFIVQFVASMTEKDVLALNSHYGIEIVQAMEGSEDTYLLRATDGHCLSVSNQYHQLEEVIYSHPNFIRVKFDRPHIQPNERIILGPDGKRYPGKKTIEKGTTEYRIVEPFEMEAPTELNSISPNAPVSKSNIKTEGFEGSFPNSWNRSGTPTWGKTSYKSQKGSFGGYCVGSGVSAPGPYPNNANSWMVFGPFSLVGAQDARVSFNVWLNSESDYDWFGVYASTNDNDYYGSRWSGDWASSSGGSGWMNISFDLKRVYGLGDLRGRSSVWIAFVFSSDSSVTWEGAYLDNIAIEKITGGYTNLTNDQYDHLQWSLKNTSQLWGTPNADIKAVNAWSITQGSAATVIAILDEGVDLTHPDITSKLVPGYDATSGGSNGGPTGDDAHGTGCAGIAAGVTNNNKGVAGIDRRARIMPIRIARSSSTGDWITTDAWIANAINWAVSHGAGVLSNSWGGGSPSSAITNAFRNAKNNGRGGKGCVITVATGNDNGSVSYPATLSEVLAVGALSPCDQRTSPLSCDGEYWWGSNYGSQVDISAPGVHMYTTDISGSAGYSSNDYFYNFNGTSSATPVVSGVAGLILGQCPNLTATSVEKIIMSTADDLGASGRDNYTGYGRVNAYKALMAGCRNITLAPIYFLLLNE